MKKYITKISLTKTIQVKTIDTSKENKNKSKYFIIDSFADIVEDVETRARSDMRQAIYTGIAPSESSIQLTEEELNRFLDAFNSIPRYIGYTAPNGIIDYHTLIGNNNE